MRPEHIVVVMGTHTGVGKTWIAVELIGRLREHGLAVAVRKPVQSFSPGDGPTDADRLAAATYESCTAVSDPARSYPLAMAPPMAAEALGLPPFTVADLATELAWPAAASVGLLETVGGPRSPVAADGDSVDLAAALNPDLVILVADAGLGAINAVRLSMAAFAALNAPVTVVLNYFDPSDDLHRRNRLWLEADGFDVAVDVSSLVGRLT